MRSDVTAWRHERIHGVPTEPGRVNQDHHDDPDVPREDHGMEVDLVPEPERVLVQPRVPVQPPSQRAARETLALISSSRVLETGAIAMNKVYNRYYGPHLPDNEEMVFGYNYYYSYYYFSLSLLLFESPTHTHTYITYTHTPLLLLIGKL